MRMPELKAIARERRLRNYSRMRKAELVELLRNNHLAMETRHPSVSQSGGPRAPVQPTPQMSWEHIDNPRPPTQQEMDIFERREMGESRPQVKTKLNKWYN